MSAKEFYLVQFKFRKYVTFKVCTLIILFINGASSRGVDKTREPNTSGEDVVKATIGQIQNSNVFTDDNGFLRRLAYVESKDGTEATTYRDGYHGGIWQIDESLFESTKLQTPFGTHRDISRYFKINWAGVDWVDLRKPLYSAIAVSMFLSLIDDPMPPLFAINSQAEFWSTHFSASTILKDKDEFINAVEDLKSEGCATAKLDVAFVVDGSGSVGEDQYSIARNFVSDIVDNFDIGPDRIRAGFIQFGKHPVVEIGMNEYTDKLSLQNTIRNIQYIEGGKTHTGEAIDLMVSALFGDGNGARHPDAKVPRVGIVMTDGQSHDEVSFPAEAARNEGIKLYAIGIGDEIDDDELRQIANDPDDHYVVHVNDYSVIDNIRYEISQDTCEEPIVPDMGKKLNNTLNAASKVYFESKFPPSGKMTFTLSASKGKATAYLSTEIRNPNEAFHQWSVESSEETPTSQVYIDTSTTPEERKRRQVPEYDELQLYGTVINTQHETESKPGEATGQPSVETVFSVLIEEGDTRIYIPTTKSDVTTTIAQEMTSEDATDPGLPIAMIAGIAVSAAVAVFVIIAVLSFVLIKRKREKQLDPNLLRGRGVSTVSTMSAEMAQYDDEPHSVPFRVGSSIPAETTKHDEEPPSVPCRVGFSYVGNEKQAYENCQMGSQVAGYPNKPGCKDSVPTSRDENKYTAEPHPHSNRASIYEVENISDPTYDSVYEVSQIGSNTPSY